MLKIPISTQSQIQTKWYRTREQSTITEHITKQNKWLQNIKQNKMNDTQKQARTIKSMDKLKYNREEKESTK